MFFDNYSWAAPKYKIRYFYHFSYRKETTKILLVTTNPKSVETLRFFEEHALVESCSDYHEAIEKIKKEMAQICLVDFPIFGHCTFDFIREAYQNNPYAIIILLVDQNDADVGTKALKLGATDYLIKSKLTSDTVQRSIRLASQLYFSQNKLKVETLERRKAQDALEQEQRQNELKSKFISIASHEFRIPLTTILSSASLIERYMRPDDERPEKHLKKIKSSVTHLVAIMNDFLSLSKLDERAVQTDFQTFELNSFIKDVVENIEVLTKENQEIMYFIDQTPFEINSDKHVLRNILNNLLSNAIKYSSANSFVYLNVECGDKNCIISVKDEGIGIPEQDQHQIFNRFFRSRNVKNAQGTGLGLSIVKRYVELLNGTIEFASVLDTGTTFKVTIPLTPQPDLVLEKSKNLKIDSPSMIR